MTTRDVVVLGAVRSAIGLLAAKVAGSADPGTN